MFETERTNLNLSVKEILKELEIFYPDELMWSPVPFSGAWGISTSFFKVAAWELRSSKSNQAIDVSVPQRAQQIASEIVGQLVLPGGFERVEAVNGYLNVYYSSAAFSRRIVDKVQNSGADYGCTRIEGNTVMVEFSQPNTHKALHVGHLRNVILGEAISNILDCSGSAVVRANYIGDIGLHVIKWMWNYQKNHTGEKPSRDKTRWMGDLYTEADQLATDNPAADAEIRELFARWDQRDSEVVALWEKSRQWSLEGFEQVYTLLGVGFDRIYFESEMEEAGKKLVTELIERKIAVDERPDGPVIIRIDDLLGLDHEEYRVLVILRSDSTSLYSTKDLPLAIRKFEDYPLERSIYVIDVRQSFYTKQIFKTLEIMGYPWTNRLQHLPYEIVNLPGNVTMSSREGAVVLLEDLIRESQERALEIVEQKNPDLSDEEKQKVAQAVGLGAIKFPMLARENTKKVTFDWESALDFEGQAAPYIQYAAVRANSILRRYAYPLPESLNPSYDLAAAEIQLIDLISRFPDEITRAANELKTLHITNYAYNLARVFNDFYNQCPVLQAESEIKHFRLRLVSAAKITLENALRILGITTPEVM